MTKVSFLNDTDYTYTVAGLEGTTERPRITKEPL